MKQPRSYPVFPVTKKAQASILSSHPWVYDQEITHYPDPMPENGTLVDVVSEKGRYLGTGLLSLHSKIRVRLLSRNANDRFDERPGYAKYAIQPEGNYDHLFYLV